LIIFGSLGTAYAREDIVPGSFYTSGQDAAMGGAAAPLASDAASALFDDPAAIAKLKGVQAEPLNLTLYSDPGLLSQMGSTPSDLYHVTSLSSMVPSLQKNPGEMAGAGGAILPNFFFKGIAFGVLAQSQLAAVANPNGTITYRSLYQLIPTVGTGIKLASGIVRIGYSLQWVNQASGTVSNANPNGTPLGYNQQLQQGSFFSHNIAMDLTLPYRYLPQLSIIGRNLFNTGFHGSSLYSFTPSSTGTPLEDPATVDVGLSYIDKLGGGNSFKFSAVDRDATNRSGITILGRMALGGELSLGDVLLLRAGWGSGYPTAGVGFKVSTSEVSFAWTSEEVGTGYHDDRDQRYMIQVQIQAF
jgi:hypothetical protein